MEINKIYNESNLDTMSKMCDNFVDLVVTSPPYDNLRTYTGESEWNFNYFKEIAKELYRVIKDGGVVVWIVGDATINSSETGTSFKQALFFKEIGFNLHDTMIYHKSNPIPQNHNRYEQSFEYMFVFVKGKLKTFNPIRIPTKHRGEIFEWGNRKTKADIKQCRRDRGSEKRITKETKIHDNIFDYQIGGSKNGYGHPAVFPEQLARDHIISWSNENDLVYDPFMGSGTTAKMAIINKRNFIGSEISNKYYEIANKKIFNTIQQLTLF